MLPCIHTLLPHAISCSRAASVKASSTLSCSSAESSCHVSYCLYTHRSLIHPIIPSFSSVSTIRVLPWRQPAIRSACAEGALAPGYMTRFLLAEDVPQGQNHHLGSVLQHLQSTISAHDIIEIGPHAHISFLRSAAIPITHRTDRDACGIMFQPTIHDTGSHSPQLQKLREERNTGRAAYARLWAVSPLEAAFPRSAAVCVCRRYLHHLQRHTPKTARTSIRISHDTNTSFSGESFLLFPESVRIHDRGTIGQYLRRCILSGSAPAPLYLRCPVPLVPAGNRGICFPLFSVLC